MDRSGLEGTFDVEYVFAPNAAADATAAEAPPFLTAVEDQLGLKLGPQLMAVPVLVIDSVERPTEH